MRQYRGLTKEGKWVYGWYCCTSERQYTDGGHPKRHFIIQDNAEYMLDRTEPNIFDITEAIEVIPETVGQQVGLKERYGKHRDIWQGDIIKWYPVKYDWDDYCSDDLNEEEIGIIVWFQPAGRWAIEVRGRTYWPKEIDFFDVEIIGSIHTMPELMEQENGRS